MKNTTVKVDNLFAINIASKKININKIKIESPEYKKSFKSNLLTSLQTETLLSQDSMNYLNINFTELLSYLLKPFCNNFVFNVSNIWINKYLDKDYQESHIHNGDFAFILYYKCDKSYTVFNSPSKNLIHRNTSNIFYEPVHYEPNFTQGDLVVFPAYLEHWVRPNSGNTTISGALMIKDIK